MNGIGIARVVEIRTRDNGCVVGTMNKVQWDMRSRSSLTAGCKDGDGVGQLSGQAGVGGWIEYVIANVHPGNRLSVDGKISAGFHRLAVRTCAAHA